MADAPEAGELLDIEVDQLAGACAVVTPRRLARFECGQPAQAEAGEMSRHGAAWQVETFGNLLAGHPVIAAQASDHGEPGRGQPVGDQVRRRAAGLQASIAFAAKAGEPLAHGAGTDLKRARDGHDAPSLLEHATHHHGSTKRRGAGILVGVHPG